jgi:hypothetical protein
MNRIVIALATACALGACANTQQSLAEGERYNWRCDGDKEFSLRYAAGNAEVYASGQTHNLPPTGEGQYSNGTVTFSESGGSASLNGAYGGPFENCHRASGAGDRSWWRFW